LKFLSVLMLLISLNTFAARVEVDVLGMTCGMCVEAITKELKATNKVDNIKVSLENKKATFQELAKTKIADSEIKAAIKKAGYEAVKIRRDK